MATLHLSRKDMLNLFLQKSNNPAAHYTMQMNASRPDKVLLEVAIPNPENGEHFSTQAIVTNGVDDAQETAAEMMLFMLRSNIGLEIDDFNFGSSMALQDALQEQEKACYEKDETISQLKEEQEQYKKEKETTPQNMQEATQQIAVLQAERDVAVVGMQEAQATNDQLQMENACAWAANEGIRIKMIGMLGTMKYYI